MPLIWLTDKPDDISIDHEYFSIREYLFDIILATHQNEGTTLKAIEKDISSLVNK